MDKSNIAIYVNGLEKAYQNNQVIKKVDLTVKEGTIFSLLGSNGAGKTTIVKILSTLIKPDSGTIQICGYDLVRQADEVRKKISLTGQFTAVDELLTGRENMQMIARLRHIPKDEDQIENLLGRFDLLKAARRLVSTYSGGMRRKLDLAMSLIGRPPIIFLDEPTTGLDPQSRLAMWQIIKDLKKTGVVIFLTTQYLEEAERLGDQIAILKDGKIVETGTPQQLKQLLPHGLIEIKFNQKQLLLSANQLLKDYNPKLNETDMLLVVSTDGSVKQIAQMFDILNYADIHIESFKQILPTLEDVFLSIIKKK